MCTSHRATVSNYKFLILNQQVTAKQDSVDKEFHKSLVKVKYSTSFFFSPSPNVETLIIPCTGVIYMLAVCSKVPKHQETSKPVFYYQQHWMFFITIIINASPITFCIPCSLNERKHFISSVPGKWTNGLLETDMYSICKLLK